VLAESVVVWRNSHDSKVPRAELWGTTVPMGPVLGGAELDQLLGVLLRMLSPGAVPPDPRPAGNEHTAGAVPVGNGPAGTAPGSAAQASSAPDSSAPDSSAPANAVPAGRPGGRARGVGLGGPRADRTARRARHRPGSASGPARPGEEHGEQAGRWPGEQGLDPPWPGRAEPPLRSALPHPAGPGGRRPAVAGV